MTRPLIARRALAATLAGITLALAGCGGGGGNDSGGNAAWRVVNLTNDVASIDTYAGSTKGFTAVAADSVSDYATIAVNSYTLKVTAAGDTTSVLASTFTFSPSKDKNYTAVATGRNGTARLVTLLDDEDTTNVVENTSRVRVYNASPDAGSLDVYITNVADIAEVSPTFGSTTATVVGGFRDVASGTYRLRVTGAGDVNDVRLDVNNLVLASKQASTLVITTGSGGVLANAAQIIQGGAVNTFKNTQARVRVIAGAQAAGLVAVSLDGSALGSALRSPSIGSYQRITAGTKTLAITLNGSSVASSSQTFTAGNDYTVVAFGTVAAPQSSVFTDDNRLPASGRYRVRLIHADAAVDAVTFQVDSQPLPGLESVQPGTASTWATGNADTSARVEILTTSGIEQIFADNEFALASQGVYTAFVLGGKSVAGTGAPVSTGIVRKDR